MSELARPRTPFATHPEEIPGYVASSSHRFALTLAFIGPTLRGTALDVGPRTPFTDLLERHYGLSIDTTEGDLDEIELHGSYDVVFHFEVLEHLMNPLFHLRQVRRVLKEDGVMFLSTPLAKPHFLWSPYHFHEMHPRELTLLLERAGFRVVRSARHRFHPLPRYLTGIRPLLRLVLERFVILEVRKAKAPG